MSAAAILLQFIFMLLGFLLSLKGLFAFLVGTIIFLGMPFIPRVTGQFRSFAHFHLRLAAWTVKRAAFVVTEHDELLFKRMSFDDLGVEKISFADETKKFEDPAVALHYFKGIPFALADEVHGIIFDPRHAAIGARKHTHEENGEMVYKATAAERSMYEVFGWVHGAFEFARDTHELVNLSHIRQLVTGSERAEHGERVREFYQKSREPYQTAPSMTRMAIIILAICAPFGVLWFIASQGSGAGGDGGSTVTFGVLLALPALRSVSSNAGDWLRNAAPSSGDDGSSIDLRRGLTAAAVLLPLPLLFIALFVYASPLLAVLVFTAIGMGFWALPFLTLFLRELGPLGGGLARYVYLTLGLAGWERPVFEWTPEKYVVREYSELDAPDSVHWYGVGNALVGFTFQPGSGSWENGTLSSTDIENRLEAPVDVSGAVVQGDGGTKTNLPVEYDRYPEQQRADVYAGFVPSERRLDDDSYYVDTGIWFQKLADAAVGKRALQELLRAKEEFGGDQRMDDSSLAKVVAGSAAFSFIAGIVVFFL